MTPRLSIFVPGPRGNLYVHPQFAADLYTLLAVHTNWAYAGEARAKATVAHTGGKAGKGQLAHWRAVIKALTALAGTLHRGIDPADHERAARLIMGREEAFIALSPYCRAERKAGDDGVN